MQPCSTPSCLPRHTPACSYLREHGEECRQPMPVQEGADPEDRVARSTTFHTGLMHA